VLIERRLGSVPMR